VIDSYFVDLVADVLLILL